MRSYMRCNLKKESWYKRKATISGGKGSCFVFSSLVLQDLPLVDNQTCETVSAFHEEFLTPFPLNPQRLLPNS